MDFALIKPAPLPPAADVRAPSANGMDPTWKGWVYVKVNIWSGICKVGFTNKMIADRLIETGEPELALHVAFHIPLMNPEYAEDAERHCHNKLGHHNRIRHLMTGGLSEFFPGPVDQVTHLVQRAVQEWYDHVFGPLGCHYDANAMCYRPVYDQRTVGLVSSLRAPYWEKIFPGLEETNAMRDVLYNRPAARGQF